jgi:acetolactate synthase-1/2/3 large subunit
MNGAQLICNVLRKLDVSHVFGLPGTQNVLLYEAMRTSGLRSVVASDEGAAAFMAAGYARASGQVGVLTTIPGPGFVYALAGIVEAQHDSVPLLWLTLRPWRSRSSSSACWSSGRTNSGTPCARRMRKP